MELLEGTQNKLYTEADHCRISALSLQTLLSRCRKADLIMIFKILTQRVSVHPVALFRETEGSPQTLYSC